MQVSRKSQRSDLAFNNALTVVCIDDFNLFCWIGEFLYLGVGEERVPRCSVQHANHSVHRHRRTVSKHFNANDEVAENRHRAEGVDDFAVRPQSCNSFIQLFLFEFLRNACLVECYLCPARRKWSSKWRPSWMPIQIWEKRNPEVPTMGYCAAGLGH